MLGRDGIRKSTEIAIVNANYLKTKLEKIIKYSTVEKMVDQHMNLL